MQSVLITGGAGFIGQNLVHAWRAARPDDRLLVVDAMTYAANVRSLEPLIADRRILFVNGDIKDAALVRRLFEEHKFSRVAHLTLVFLLLPQLLLFTLELLAFPRSNGSRAMLRTDR